MIEGVCDVEDGIGTEGRIPGLPYRFCVRLFRTGNSYHAYDYVTLYPKGILRYDLAD